jgi:hypothetical protein
VPAVASPTQSGTVLITANLALLSDSAKGHYGHRGRHGRGGPHRTAPRRQARGRHPDRRDGTTIPFRLDRTTTAGRARKLTVQISYDGKTWQPGSFVLLGDRGVLLEVKPGPVSLRTRVTDVNGNSGEQTIIRALT